MGVSLLAQWAADGTLRTGASAVLTVLFLYLFRAACRCYFFPRPDSLKERFPFEYTMRLATEQNEILELVKLFCDDEFPKRGKKTFVLNVLGLSPIVVTGDIPNITYVLKTNFENFGKSSENFYPKFYGLLGNGIFNADHQQWFAHRKTSAHLFKLENFKNSVLSIFNEDMDQVIDRIRKLSAEKKQFDFQDIMQRFTLESISKIAFGAELGCIKNEDVDFAYDFDYCTNCINNSMLDPFWRFFRYLTPGGWKYFYCLYRLNKVAYGMIKKKRAELAASAANGGGEADESESDDAAAHHKVDLLSLYLDKGNFESSGASEGSAGGASEGSLGSKYGDTYLKPTDSNLRDVFLNMIIAGRDTTANALSWSFYRLCLHPEVQKAVRDEVIAVLGAAAVVVGGNNKGGQTTELSLLRSKGGHGVVSYKSLQAMKYLEAFVYELLRLYPSVPKEAKGVLKDDTLPDGTKVKKGDILTFFPWIMGRDKDLWGEDAEEFKPERFLDKPKPNPFIYTAFQAGPRTCLGQNFAILEMKCCIARLLVMFEFQLEQDPKSVTYTNSLTLPIRDGLKVSVKAL